MYLGAFYGRPAILGGETLSPITLKSLESKILSEYYHARDKLVSSLGTYVSVLNKSLDPALLKQHEDLVTASNQACNKLQVRLARLRSFVRQYQEATGSVSGGRGKVFTLEGETRKLLLADVSSSQLCKTIGCLEDTLLVLSQSAAGKEAVDGSRASPPSPHLSEEECSLVFMTLCVQGIPKLHARSCALLITLCGSQPWWGSFVTGAVTCLYGSSQTIVFHKERYALVVFITLYPHPVVCPAGLHHS